MKTILVLLTALFALNGVSAQSCFPEGITFTTQAQIDNFSSLYPGCTEIEGDVTISGYNISNLYGLDVISSIWGSLRIVCNDAVTSLEGLDNLTSIGGNLYIEGNYVLSDLTALQNLTFLGGDLQFTDNLLLASLAGFEGLTSVGGDLWINDNVSLTSLTGLNNVDSISGVIRIYSNDGLVSFSGLEGLAYLGGSLSIGGEGHLGGVGNTSLVSLEALHNLDGIGGDVIIGYNTSLASLSGLDNIEPGSVVNLSVFHNDTLSECEVQSICNYLISPNGFVTINDNATGCNSIQEIMEACQSYSSFDRSDERPFTIYPNPSSGMIHIEASGAQVNSRIVIVTSQGRELFRQQLTCPVTQIDMTSLPGGVYFATIFGQHTVRTTKLVRY